MAATLSTGADTTKQSHKVVCSAYYFLTGLLASALALSGCSATHTPAATAAPTQAGNQTNSKLNAIPGSRLPHPVSCMSWVVPYGSTTELKMMPYNLIIQIAQGKGLPVKFYTSGIVPKDFCKPTHGVWKFPLTRQEFYDTDEATLQREQASNHERAVIKASLSRVRVPDRFYVKWMRSNAKLIVFSMKPTNTGTWFSVGPPYIVLNGSEIVIPDSGEVGQPPPRV